MAEGSRYLPNGRHIDDIGLPFIRLGSASLALVRIINETGKSGLQFIGKPLVQGVSTW
jgi:hypothetical protein